MLIKDMPYLTRCESTDYGFDFCLISPKQIDMDCV